jgi:hypothetical protein
MQIRSEDMDVEAQAITSDICIAASGSNANGYAGL